MQILKLMRLLIEDADSDALADSDADNEADVLLILMQMRSDALC